MPNTLATTEELADVFFERFRVVAAPLRSMATDFSSQRAKMNQPVIAKVGQTPSAAQDYHATDGFFPAGDDVKDLLVDVPVTIDQFKTIPITIDFEDTTEASIDLIEGAYQSAAEVMGKTIVDYALAQVVAANFSKNSVFTTGNSDYDMLEDVRKDLNSQGVGQFGRFGLVSPDVYSTLDGDSRISSRDYRGQMSDQSYGHLKNIKGFTDIWEYPDFPANGENLSAFFGNASAIAVASRLPNDMSAYMQRLGATQVISMVPQTDPDTGITMLFVTSQDGKTGDLRTAVAAMFGAAAGKQGGASDAILDNAGHRVVTA
ncbi:MAG: hypothetical protein AAFX93_20395 [Verrucomicrobiota bacterium]